MQLLYNHLTWFWENQCLISCYLYRIPWYHLSIYIIKILILLRKLLHNIRRCIDRKCRKTVSLKEVGIGKYRKIFFLLFFVSIFRWILRFDKTMTIDREDFSFSLFCINKETILLWLYFQIYIFFILYGILSCNFERNITHSQYSSTGVVWWHVLFSLWPEQFPRPPYVLLLPWVASKQSGLFHQFPEKKKKTTEYSKYSL